jgi:N-acetyl-gamma-glutamyl-phosphate reductase common form
MTAAAAPTEKRQPALVVGGSGYVAGELLRLLATHPNLEARWVLSSSQAGTRAAEAFPHLSAAYPDLVFSGRQALPEILGAAPRLAVFSAAPHGASAPIVDAILDGAERTGCEARVVDLSADYRHADATTWASIYDQPHPAPARLGRFTCALPEHFDGVPAGHVSHPGCFTTAAVLAAAPLLAAGLAEPVLHVSAVTGSTGSGRTPGAGTHHPERRSNLYAYAPLGHRHAPEMRALVSAAAGVEPEIHFVPHSGPFARGIHATIQARCADSLTTEEAVERVARFYAGAPFVRVSATPPRLQPVVGTNLAAIGVAARGGALAAFCAIDNLVKGAAGGAVQWMNRLLGFPETAGLTAPGPGWL